MKIVKLQDAELRCEHLPRPGAPALLMLNSLGTSLELWDEQAAALAERFELVRYDVRGHGKSSVGARSELTIAQLADDALAVLDACGIARAHLCGLSLGGMTAMHIARHSPDRVLRVMLCNTAPHIAPQQAWQARIDTVLNQGMVALTEGILERWFTPGFRADHADKVDQVRQMLLATDPRGYAACCAAIRDMDLRDDIRSLDAITLVIGGTLDPATPPAQAELIHQSIKSSRLMMLEAAHLSNIERAAEFTATLLDFLAPETTAS